MAEIQGDTIEIRAKVLSARQYNNNFFILRCDQGKAPFAALGVLHFEGDVTGTVVTLTGKWDNHPQYGRQFKFVSCKPEGGELYFFLAKIVRGVGEKLAQSLIDRYGEELLVEILDKDPGRLTEVKGIKDGKLARIVASWQKYRPLQELSGYLSPHDIPAGLVIKIFNHLGERAVSVIRENPYKLTQVPGIGFKKADDIALRIGIEPHSQFRIDSCIEYVLSNLADDSGDTVAEPQKVVGLAKKELDSEKTGVTISPDEIMTRIEALLEAARLVKMNDLISLSYYHSVEKMIMEIMKRRQILPSRPIMSEEEAKTFISAMEKELGVPGFSEEQQKAIHLAAAGHRTFIICGYAGTGKSTISKAVLKLLAKFYDEEEICCMALSGIASDRIRKTSGFAGATIHTTLGWKGNKFEYDSQNPLPHKVVLLDETSMVNSVLFRKVLEAVKDDAVFIMLGDPSQLPPIGSGDVFSNLVESRYLPMVELTKIYRQGEDSVLVLFANEIRQGRVPQGYDRVGGYKDFEFIERSLPKKYYSLSDKEKEPARVQNTAEILQVISQKTKAISGYIENPVTDYQVLSPMRRGPLGTEALNRYVQEILNPGGAEGEVLAAGGYTFKPGDKVVHTSNKDMSVVPYYLYKEKGGFHEEWAAIKRIFNGSVGSVLKVDPEEKELFVSYPDGHVVRYEPIHLGDILELAYGLTVHKAQGSEYQNVVLPITSLHFIMLNAQWLYTALTRAKRKIVVTGQKNMFERACKSLVMTKRNTVLSHLLDEVARNI